jgi:hypothetical protein
MRVIAVKMNGFSMGLLDTQIAGRGLTVLQSGLVLALPESQLII